MWALLKEILIKQLGDNKDLVSFSGHGVVFSFAIDLFKLQETVAFVDPLVIEKLGITIIDSYYGKDLTPFYMRSCRLEASIVENISFFITGNGQQRRATIVERPLGLTETQQQLTLFTRDIDSRALLGDIIHSAFNHGLINKIIWQQGPQGTLFPNTMDLNVSAAELWQFVRQQLENSKSPIAARFLKSLSSLAKTKPMLMSYSMHREETAVCADGIEAYTYRKPTNKCKHLIS